MGDDEIRQYISSRASAPASLPPPRGVTRRPQAPRATARRAPARDTFGDLNASHMLCPKCRKATPVREKLLLYLADGDLYGYLCSVCGTSVGTRKAGKRPAF